MKIYSFVCKGFAAIWSLFAFTTIVLLLFFQATTEYVNKTVFDISNRSLLLIGLFALCVITTLYIVFRERIDGIMESVPTSAICYLSIVLFIVEAIVFYNMYFITWWDSGVVVTLAKQVASDGYGGMSHPYVSSYPNNMMIIWIYSILFKLNAFIGDVAYAEYFVIVMQCLGATFTGYLLFKVVNDITKPFYAYLAWIVYVFHIALNPWISIPYSDSVALLIPLSILRIYQKIENKKQVLLKWFLIGFLGYVGYKIKPQVLIVTIAIFIVDFTKQLFISNKKEKLLSLGRYATAVVAVMLSVVICSNIIIPSLKIEIDKSREIGVTHFLMMGLNPETNGSYSQSDVDFSNSFDSVKQRSENNLKIAEERLKEFGFSGLVKHLAKKNLSNYGDGTYAWGKEGNFYAQCFDDKNKGLSPLLKSLYYSSSGENYQYFATFENLVWVTLVFCSCGIVLYIIRKNQTNAIVLAATLSLIGISLFQLIFETRARYLFIYSPFYIIVALFGWIGIASVSVSTIKKIKEKRKKL